VRVGRRRGPLTWTPHLPAGCFTVPADVPGTRWGVVYGVHGAATPVEVQWTTSAERIPHITEPFIGHLPRMPLPGAASAMTVTPTGTGVSFSSTRVAFTGVWGESPTTSAAGGTLTFNLNNVVPFTGPKGAPEPALGDRAVVLNYGVENTPSTGDCVRATGGSVFPLTPTAGTVATTPIWYTERLTRYAVFSTIEEYGRIYNGLINVTGGTAETKLSFGKVATLDAPLFTARRGVDPIRMPAMITLFECGLAQSSSGSNNTPVELAEQEFERLTGLGVGRYTSSRTITGTSIALVHGYVAAATSTTLDYALSPVATLPYPPYTLGDTDLGLEDHVALPAGTAPLALTFGSIAAQGDDAVDTSDYYEVVLHQVQGAGITPVRTFRVPGRSVSIDRGLLTAGSEYVFELRSFAGAPQAQLTDFTTYTLPQSQGVMYTRTFIAP